MVMAKYAVIEDIGGEQIEMAGADTKDDLICALVHMMMERCEPEGVKVTYPDKSYYAWGTLDPNLKDT
jgi:hypothetical protein